MKGELELKQLKGQVFCSCGVFNKLFPEVFISVKKRVKLQDGPLTTSLFPFNPFVCVNV